MGRRNNAILSVKKRETGIFSRGGDANTNALANTTEINKLFFDPLGLQNLFGKALDQFINQPQNWMAETHNFWMESLALANAALNVFSDPHKDMPTLVAPSPTDRRFKESLWNEIPSFKVIMQSYLLVVRWVQSALSKIEGLSPQENKKLRFCCQQILDALAPTNCPWTNPKVLTKALETKGESLLNGLSRLLGHLHEGMSLPNIQNVDKETFRVGQNLATTKGKVVFQNELMQLIQYEPLTKETHAVPLLIIPAWINKFYLFDLQEHNSFIQWALKQEFTVFIISWVNPDRSHSRTTFEDYMRLGPLTALEIIRAITQSPTINAIGSCLGAALLSCVLGYLGERAKEYFNCATLLTPLFDFSKAGDLLLFTDNDYLEIIKEKLNAFGYLDGATLAGTFNMLRANDLIWSAFINNYLLDEELPRLDFLYWNADNTNLPAPMYRFYLDEFFHNNAFMHPSHLTLLGKPIELNRVTIPIFILSARDDHIAPWLSGYAGAHLFGGKTTFVLASSGHIVGVINPPSQQKYGYWVNDNLTTEPEAWLSSASFHVGSWWETWAQWMKEYEGPSITARFPSKGLEDAPGSYVYKAWNENLHSH